MSHVSPSSIFSPSIARQQLAAAKDWNYIDNWLSSKFAGKPAPPFERNHDTLKALLALAALNESADEERDLMARVESKALSDIQAEFKADQNTDLLTEIEDALTTEGKTSLETLAGLSVALNQPIADVEKMGSGIINLSVTSFDLEQASNRVAILERHLAKELEQISALVKELQSEKYQPSSGIAKETVDFQRKVKLLTAKLPEMRDRVASLEASVETPEVTVEDVEAAEDKFKELLATVRDLETQVKSYHGLPQDTDLARLELESVRVELRQLTKERDAMFEGLVERESPQKVRR